MREEFDAKFEQNMLDLLTAQCLRNFDKSGAVVFGCLEKENRLSFSFWGFDDDTCEELKECGYKYYLQALLDNLIIYRSSHGQLHSRDGVLKIDGQSTKIKWLLDGEAKKLIDSCME